MAWEHGADFEKVYHAMTYRYPRGQGIPKPGLAGGPCLLKDTMQLAAFSKDQFPLGQAARLANEGFPEFMVERARELVGGKLEGVRVGILGMAFKAESDDTRGSLSYKLAKLLRFHGARVLCSDEYVKEEGFVTKEEVVRDCGVVIVGVPHEAARELPVAGGARGVVVGGGGEIPSGRVRGPRS
jgi:UDP-N-acetyl-D-mannosaminuronic acid dehydrogenase